MKRLSIYLCCLLSLGVVSVAADCTLHLGSTMAVAAAAATESEEEALAGEEEELVEQVPDILSEMMEILESAPEELKQELMRLRQETLKFTLQSELEQAKLALEIVKLTAENERLQLEEDVRAKKLAQELSVIEAEKQRLSMQNDVQDEILRKEKLKLSLRLASPDYRLEPFQDGRLIISDRRVEIDDYLFSGSADEITKMIAVYNNEDPHYPIFLIINRCLGGSVIEGARILEAMENSQAPVYVVVKSLAASMAAIITARAEHSFAYPNAIFIHHQLSTEFYGPINTKEVDERLKVTRSWSDRILQPVAAKMNLSLEDFVAKMYQHNPTTGNWVEFATEAQRLGWVKHVVTDMRETSYLKRPEEETEEEDGSLEAYLNRIPRASVDGYGLTRDEQGYEYVKLPQPAPGDIYYIYNPGNYFRR